MNPNLLLGLGILSSSFFGSWHCAGMCGPVASLMAQKKSLKVYHLGRLVAYVFLGLLGGGLGEFFLNSNFMTLRFISAFFFASILIVMGLSSLFPRIKFQPTPLSNLFQKIHAFHLNQSAIMVGIFTALLPCGWLYTYVTAAISSKSPWAGGLVMFLFWLGGIPALSVVPSMVRKSIQQAPWPQQKIAGLILIAAGLYSIFSFFVLH
jgi:hypothetical protein